MPIAPALGYDVFKTGVYNDLGLAGATEHYIYGDGVTAAPGIYYLGSGWIPPLGWTRLKSLHGAKTVIGVPPAGDTTDWIRAFNIRAPTATPVVTSVTKSDNTLSNILAPFYAWVDWSGSPGSEPNDLMHVTWFQNGTVIESVAVSTGASPYNSPGVYYHGDTYRVTLDYYDPDSGYGGPIADSGTLTY